MSTDQIPPISKGTGGAEYAILVTAINDRLRRINIALGQQDTAAASAPGPIAYGTHAQRLGQPTPADGTLYIETDRGGVIYRVAGTQWAYLSGEWAAPYAQMPTGLTKNDYGFKFFDTDNWRRFEWAKTGGAPSNASPGWRRAAGEVPTGQIVILPYGVSAGAMATGWVLCDGSTNVKITQDDATLLTITVAQMIGSYPKGGTVGSYSPPSIAAVAPRISGLTETALTGIGQDTQDVGTGATGAGAITEPPSGHSHGLDYIKSPITLPGDPVQNVPVPFFMKR